MARPCRVAGCHVGARILLVASVLEDWRRQNWFKGKNGELKVHSRHIHRRLLIEWTLVISGDIMKRYERPIPRIGWNHQLALIMTKIWHQNYATTLFPVPRTRQKSSTWQKTWHGTSEGNSWNLGWKMATSIAVTFLKLVSGPFFPMRLGELLGR